MTTTIATTADIHHKRNAEENNTDRKLTDQGMSAAESFVEHVNDLQVVDHAINLGDSIQHTGYNAGKDQRNFQEVTGTLGNLKVPCHSIAGNHDLMNLSEFVVANMLGRQSLNFSTDLGEHHLIALHSRATKRNGGDITIDAGQLQWLDDELARIDKPVMVITHHPLSDQDLSSNYWFADHPDKALVADRDAVRSIIEQRGNVIAVLNGHTHCNSLELHDGIPYVTQNSPVENINGSGLAAATHGLVTLKGAQFGMEIFGNDTSILTHSDITESLGKTYDSVAKKYMEKTAPYGKPECDEFDKVAALVGDRSNLRVVDFACGPARDASHFMSRGYNYVGVDASAEFIKHGRSTYPDAEFHHGDFATLELPKASADIVWHSSSLQHVEHRMLGQALQRAYDTLKPGGYFYAHYRSGQGESIQISTEYETPIARFIALYEENEMNQALKDVGFEIVESRTFDHQYPGLKGTTVKYKTKVFARKPE